MHREQAGGRRHAGGDVRDRAGEFAERGARAPEGLGNGEPPQPRVGEGGFGVRREYSGRRERCIGQGRGRERGGQRCVEQLLGPQPLERRVGVFEDGGHRGGERGSGPGRRGREPAARALPEQGREWAAAG